MRRAARLLVVDRDARLLLLPAHDPVDPRQGTWWEVPGGGVEPGETAARAAVREVAEETGVVVPPAAVGAQAWRVRATYVFGLRLRVVEETLLVARLPGAVVARAVDRMPYEDAVLGAPTWVPLTGLAALRTYPAGLAARLPALLAGRSVRSAPQRWG